VQSGCASVLIAATWASHAFAQTAIGHDRSGHTDVAHIAPSHSDARIDSLLSVARKASLAFSDRSAAISAGYRRVGMDFPSMGEHWVNPRLVFEGKFDVGHPAILTYSMVHGRPTLLGVVFAIPLAPGEAPPAAFGSRAIWHEHNGSLEEESLLPEHHSMPSTESEVRLAVLHAWVRAANPDGVFEAENWALPFVRLGLDVPASFPKGAARALALLSGGDRYFLSLGGDQATVAIASALAGCRDVARNIVSRAQTRGQPIAAADLRDLDRAWSAAVLSVRNAAGSDAAKRINGGIRPNETR